MNRSRRTWLFVPGADEASHEAAALCGADVLIHELEDFTLPALRPAARALARTLYDRWRSAGAIAAVRVNPLATCGGEDLAYVRARFLVECRAAGVEAIDCPYTFSDARGAAADARYAKRLGYRAKSLLTTLDEQ
jgi:citrate lyase beta subunit